MRYYRLVFPGFIVLGLMVLLTACGGQLSEGGVSGTWTGALTNTEEPLTLELTQIGVQVSGELTFGNAAVTMTGTAANNLVSLSYEPAGSESIGIEASVSGDAMRGVLAVETAGDITSRTFTAVR